MVVITIMPDMGTHTFVTQIGTFKIRMWACSYMTGSFAGHQTWEILNTYSSINELSLRIAPRLKLQSLNSAVGILDLPLANQKQFYTFR